MLRHPTLRGRARQAARGAKPDVRVNTSRPRPRRGYRERWVAPFVGLLLACLTLGGSGCGDEPSSADAPLTVFAAASLTDAFTELGDEFAAAHPEVTLRFNFAGSGELATQLEQRAPADVFASADMRTMGEASDLVGAQRIFGRNRMMIAVAPGNPHGVTGLSDLASRDLKVVLAAPDVPAGRYAEEILDRAGMAVSPVSLEASVKGVVSKIALGEADAGIVYVTDVAAARDTVTGVAIPTAQNVVADYPIATVSAAINPNTAAVFVDFVLSPAGQATLARHGFSPGDK